MYIGGEAIGVDPFTSLSIIITPESTILPKVRASGYRASVYLNASHMLLPYVNEGLKPN